METDILATMPRREIIDPAAEEWRERRDLRFIVTSRRCVRHRISEAGQPCSVISVSEPPPVMEPVRFPPQFHLRDVLRLTFCDLDPINHPNADFDAEAGNYGVPWRDLLMTNAHALQIWNFLANVKEKLLIIHCYAGISRSPSIAMAVADSLDIPRTSIIWNEDLDPAQHPPNRHVYNCVRRAFFHWKRETT